MDFWRECESIDFLFLKIEWNSYATTIPIFLNVGPPIPFFNMQSTIPLTSLHLNNQITSILPVCSIVTWLIELHYIESIYQSIFHSEHSFWQSCLGNRDNWQMILVPFVGQIYQKVYMLMWDIILANKCMLNLQIRQATHFNPNPWHYQWFVGSQFLLISDIISNALSLCKWAYWLKLWPFEDDLIAIMY